MTLMIRRLWYLYTLLVSVCLPVSVSGHHSFAMFDSENQLKFTGKAADFDWTNPRV